ncbi:MAG: sugar ABC transporter substrate-binding protein [Sphaerochaetaceae bacterium]|nr:sugar ABC transporter substrate-binding protein [Sphaerochaetaceae bacterium]MDC7236956.1 sugar ABC transporter substrate-binding protein [Sphaerochaetaceae bacterium]MDC7248919.1 sugar ABC transporter substrate-binding protein [Sphaerochaetaceae bacterium]
MKKTFTILTIVLFSCASIFAQGSSESAKADETITLEFMQWWEPEMAPGVMEAICSEYEAANPGIKIKRISKPYSEVQSQVTIGAASGTLSDVLGCDPTWIYNLVKQDAVQPLDEFMSADNYDESQLASISVLNGKKYLINVENFIYPLFYNTDMFEEAGISEVPKTHSEFISAAEKLTDTSKNQYGWDISLSLQNPTGIQNDIMSLVWASDGSGVPEPNNEDVAKVFNLVKTMNDKGLLVPGFMTAQEQDKVEHFVNNRCAMMVDSLAHINMIRERNADLNFDIALPPVADDYSGPHILDMAAWGITISKSSEHPQEAWDFVKYIMSPEINARIADSVNAFPGNINGDPNWVKEDALNQKAFALYKDNGVRNEFQGAPEANNLMRLMSEQLQAMLNGKQTVSQALENTSDAWAKVYAK